MSARPPGGRVAALGVALAVGGEWHAVAILVFLAAILWADEAAGALARAAAAVRERARQRRELDQQRLDLVVRRLQAALDLQSQALPAPCAHEQAIPVTDLSGNVVACLCPQPQCYAQLPADFRACEEAR